MEMSGPFWANQIKVVEPFRQASLGSQALGLRWPDDWACRDQRPFGANGRIRKAIADDGSGARGLAVTAKLLVDVSKGWSGRSWPAALLARRLRRVYRPGRDLRRAEFPQGGKEIRGQTLSWLQVWPPIVGSMAARSWAGSSGLFLHFAAII